MERKPSCRCQFQVGNVGNRSDPASDMFFVIDPWGVNDVQESGRTGRKRYLLFVLDALTAQYARDIWADYLEHPLVPITALIERPTI
jgi:hypothetical protein